MFNYEDYLLNELNIAKASLGFDDFNIKISSERSFRMPSQTDGKILLFIIKRLTGPYVFNVKTQPIQIICYSEINSMSTGMQILDLFTKTHNNLSQIIDNELVKQNYDTVVTLRPLLPSESGFKASVYCYGNYVVCSDLADITNFNWNSKTVNYLTLGIGYSAVLNTTKKSGEEISTSLKQEAGLILSMSLMNDNSDFCKMVNKVMLGTESGNTEFLFNFTLNGVVYSNIAFILTNSSFTTNRTDAPALQLTFTR